MERLKTPPPLDHSGITKMSRDIKDLDSQLKWADAFVLVYSVTDKCSFDECNRLKFLINYHKRRRKLTNNKVDIHLRISTVIPGYKRFQYSDYILFIVFLQKSYVVETQLSKPLLSENSFISDTPK